MRRAPAYEGAVAPDPVISHLSATVDRAARWRRVVFRTSLAGACVLIAMLAMMILADTAYGGWIEDLTGLSISGIVNNFFTALGLGDGVAAIMQSASDTWLSQLASYKFDVDASRVADVIAVINKAAAPVGESLIMVFLFQGVFKKVTATDGSFIHGEGLYELVMMLVKFFLYKTLIDLAPLLIYGILLAVRPGRVGRRVLRPGGAVRGRQLRSRADRRRRLRQRRHSRGARLLHRQPAPALPRRSLLLGDVDDRVLRGRGRDPGQVRRGERAHGIL